MSRTGWFIFGAAVGIIVIVPVSAYLFARLGGIAMATTSKPLPFEETFAHTALRASMGNAGAMQNPLPNDETNLLAGAQVYLRNCAVCHGSPGQSKTAIAQGEFPPPPQLFAAHEMVTHDPQGVTYWKVSHGIRLSGMPGFASALSDDQRWQVTILLANADKLPPAVARELSQANVDSGSENKR